jgi:hypothetical protein
MWYSLVCCDIFVARHFFCKAWSCAAIISLLLSDFTSPVNSQWNVSSAPLLLIYCLCITWFSTLTTFLLLLLFRDVMASSYWFLPLNSLPRFLLGEAGINLGQIDSTSARSWIRNCDRSFQTFLIEWTLKLIYMFSVTPSATVCPRQAERSCCSRIHDTHFSPHPAPFCLPHTVTTVA